jgi:hypothetical protein
VGEGRAGVGTQRSRSTFLRNDVGPASLTRFRCSHGTCAVRVGSDHGYRNEITSANLCHGDMAGTRPNTLAVLPIVGDVQQNSILIGDVVMYRLCTDSLITPGRRFRPTSCQLS